uniref:Uncharacterized protein n=1 Tax=Photinus pyralis TaxID=7054 RepID=A0A1Y1KW86_PHOPY
MSVYLQCTLFHFHGMKFSAVKKRRSDCVITMKALNTMKVRDENRLVDPLILFKRISILKKSDAQLKKYLEYELAPYPLALFDEKGMRKCVKSTLYKIFPESDLTQYDKTKSTYVIDAGFLLRKILWERGETYKVTCQKYVSYVERRLLPLHSVSTPTDAFIRCKNGEETEC